MRSVSVVLPESMWALIPMLRIFERSMTKRAPAGRPVAREPFPLRHLNGAANPRLGALV
jgi:hypothetical protein